MLDDKILRVFASRSQAYASNTHIFLLWMVGTSLVLLGIAIMFLRSQIRPILSLAEAAEQIRQGAEAARNFHPRGADEVRRAGLAFLQHARESSVRSNREPRCSRVSAMI